MPAATPGTTMGAGLAVAGKATDTLGLTRSGSASAGWGTSSAQAIPATKLIASRAPEKVRRLVTFSPPLWMAEQADRADAEPLSLLRG